MSKFYAVKLSMQIGQYEKHVVHAVQADNSTEAGIRAIENECHNVFDVILRGSEVTCLDDGMAYRVVERTEITEETFNTLKEYL